MIFDFFGFIFFDLLYIAVIVTYVSQCQLIRAYIGTIIDKVSIKLQGYTLEQAMTEINQTYKFLQVVNGKLSALTSLCLLVFIESAVSCKFSWGGGFVEICAKSTVSCILYAIQPGWHLYLVPSYQP